MGRKSNKAKGWRYRHAPTPPSANGVGASTTITAANAPTAGTKITIRTSDGSSQEFTCHGSTTNATLFSRGGSKHGLDNLKTSIESSSIASKVTKSLGVNCNRKLVRAVLDAKRSSKLEKLKKIS